MTAKKEPIKRNHPAIKKQKTKEQKPTWWTRVPKRTKLICGVGFVVIWLGVMGSQIVSHIELNRQRASQANYVQAMYNVSDIMALHPKSTLVVSRSMLDVLQPTLARQQRTFVLDSCPSATDAVVKQLQKQSLAILVGINNNPGPRKCTLAQIVQAYGRPDTSTTLTGTLSNPKEALLFYDKGLHLSGPIKPISPAKAPATVVPETLSALPPPVCAGKTILSVVAHEDDDLLFMNPDHSNELHSGACLRTVYLTAGDDGLSSGYWLAREKGAEAAYDFMEGHGASLWLERYISVNSHEYIRMATPRSNPYISLIYVRLPDGNLAGNGFPRTYYKSLEILKDGTVSKLSTVDSQSSYTSGDLINLLVSLMQYYHPDEIDTQTPVNDSAVYPDHSDHVYTGQYTASAYGLYGRSIPLLYYTGYPIALLTANIANEDLTYKSNVFYTYAAHDSQVCKIAASCPNSPYTQWLEREYTYTIGSPLITAPLTLPPPVATTPSPTAPTTPPSSTTTPPSLAPPPAG